MVRSKPWGQGSHPPANVGGFSVGADMVNIQDTMLAPIKQVDTEPEGLTQEELSEFINVLKVI